MMKTYAPKPRDIERRWYVIDADGAVLGRLASEVAKILRGKHKPIFAPHADTGDHVIVVNARKVRLTGGKEQKKVAYRHSGYPGGLRAVTYDRLLGERPATAVEKAVRGMLPKNRLGRSIIRKLAVYEGPDHPHAAQKPVALALGEVPSWGGLPAREPAAASPRPRRRPKRAEEPAEEAAEEAAVQEEAADERPAPKRSTTKTTAKRSTTKTTAKRSTTKTTAKRSTTKTTAKRSTAKRSAGSAETKETARKTTRRRRTKREEES